MIVYSMLNQHNGKRYIGYTSKSLKKRRQQHLYALRSNSHNNNHLQRMWNQGDRYLLWTILEVCNSIENMKSAEIKWIAHYNTTDSSMGYNLTHGGEGVVATEEVRKKMGQSLKGRTFTNERIENMRLNHRGMSGRRHSVETREKMRMTALQKKNHNISESCRNSTLGKPLSDEHRKSISRTKTGRPWSAARREAYNKNRVKRDML